MKNNEEYQKCAFVNPTSGKPCGAWVLTGEDYCLFHSQSDRAKELRASGRRKANLMFGKFKVNAQYNVVQFMEKYIEFIANTPGVKPTPQMTKSISDLIGQYVSMKQLEMEQ